MDSIVNFHIKYNINLKLNEYIFYLNSINKSVNIINRYYGVNNNREIKELSPIINKIEHGSISMELCIKTINNITKELLIGVLAGVIASEIYDGVKNNIYINDPKVVINIDEIKNCTKDIYKIECKYGQLIIKTENGNNIEIIIDKKWHNTICYILYFYIALMPFILGLKLLLLSIYYQCFV